MSVAEYRVYENRLRRMAARQGLRLYKSRRRDPRAYDWNTYEIGDVNNNMVAGWLLSLDDVERYLTATPKERADCLPSMPKERANKSKARHIAAKTNAS